jgi:hypothetical protein
MKLRFDYDIAMQHRLESKGVANKTPLLCLFEKPPRFIGICLMR